MKNIPVQKIAAGLFLVIMLVLGGRGIYSRMHPAGNAGDSATWTQLAQATGDNEHATYPPVIAALDGKVVTISGFIFPLEGANNLSHFLLSAYQPTCPYCLPGSKAEMIEVKNVTETVEYGWGQTTLRGKLHLLKTPLELQNGMLYELTDAAPVK